jgi:pseudouridine kinase
MNTRNLVLVVGAAGIDLKASPHQSLILKADNPGIIRRSFGGVARNIAENLTRLELNTVFLSAVGAGVEGDSLMNYCQIAGMNMDYVKRETDHHTGTFLAVMDEHSDMAFAISDFGIMETVNAAYLESHRDLFAVARMIVIDLNLTPSAIAKVFELAGEYHVPVIADPTAPLLAHKLCTYLDRTYLVTPNAAETTLLCGLEVHDHDSAIQAARHLIKLGTEIAIVTLGMQGLVYADAKSKGHIPAIETTIVDTTGAGDALTAGLIFGLVNEIPLDEALRLGVTAAVITLRSPCSVSPDLTPDLLYNSLVI